MKEKDTEPDEREASLLAPGTEREIIVVHRSEPTVASRWSQVETLARILSLGAIPLILAISGAAIQNAVSSKTLARDYVQLAVSILSNDDPQPLLRDWAVDLLVQHAPTKPTGPLIQGLRSGGLSLKGMSEAELSATLLPLTGNPSIAREFASELLQGFHYREQSLEVTLTNLQGDQWSETSKMEFLAARQVLRTTIVNQKDTAIEYPISVTYSDLVSPEEGTIEEGTIAVEMVRVLGRDANNSVASDVRYTRADLPGSSAVASNERVLHTIAGIEPGGSTEIEIHMRAFVRRTGDQVELASRSAVDGMVLTVAFPDDTFDAFVFFRHPRAHSPEACSVVQEVRKIRGEIRGGALAFQGITCSWRPRPGTQW